MDSEPTQADLERGWRAIPREDGDDRADDYECLRTEPDEPIAGRYCAEIFQTRRALGSHQGRGHTRKARAGAKAAEHNELAFDLGLAIIAGGMDVALERRVIRRIRELAIASEDSEVAGLANALLALLGDDK